MVVGRYFWSYPPSIAVHVLLLRGIAQFNGMGAGGGPIYTQLLTHLQTVSTVVATRVSVCLFFGCQGGGRGGGVFPPPIIIGDRWMYKSKKVATYPVSTGREIVRSVRLIFVLIYIFFSFSFFCCYLTNVGQKLFFLLIFFFLRSSILFSCCLVLHLYLFFCFFVFWPCTTALLCNYTNNSCTPAPYKSALTENKRPWWCCSNCSKFVTRVLTTGTHRYTTTVLVASLGEVRFNT